MNYINNNETKKIIYKRALKISAGLFCFCFGLQFYLSNRYAVKNHSLQEYIRRNAELKKEIARLEYKSSLLSSLSYVEEKAKKQGFVEMNESLLTIGPVTVASVVEN